MLLYLIPDEDLLAAMGTAVLRGVEVRLIVSSAADQLLVSLAQRSYYAELLRAGVRIHQFRTYLLHAKSVSIDSSVAVIGSSNVDLRSFELNQEASLLLYDPRSARQVEAVHQRYLANADELTLAAWQRRSPLRKLAENLARLLGPLL